MSPQIVELRGEAAKAALDSQIEAHRNGINDRLSRFDGRAATTTWMETLRGIEELINVSIFGLDEDPVLARAFVSLPVLEFTSHPRRVRAVRLGLAYHYGEAFADRFFKLLLCSAAIGISFQLNGRSDIAAGFITVAHLVGYLQSRRRHLVTIMYTIAEVGTGTERLESLDALNQLLPIAELGVSLTSLFQQRLLAEVFDDFVLRKSGEAWVGSREFPALDDSFSEPERASIIDIQAAARGSNAALSLEPISATKLFSAAEVRNDIRIIEDAFGEFELELTEFGTAGEIVTTLSHMAIDDHWIVIGIDEFNELLDNASASERLRRELVHSGADYVRNGNSYAPMVQIGSELRSSVTLFTRFLNRWKNVCLDRIRRYQIRTGFVFETSVSRFLVERGFDVKNVKRIDRKEFDVVAVRGGVIYNIQCKNNLVDLSTLEGDIQRFAKRNKALVNGYERALTKEKKRAHLLQKRLGTMPVEQFVVCRFPVATDNERIVTYSRIEKLDELAARYAAS